MKKVIFAFAVAMILSVACKPKVYLGPLDSPIGNWRSSESIYYFNEKTVWQDNSCEYSAISFYKDSLCCIEGRKGAFKYYMSEVDDSLVVDSIAWHIEELTGRFLKLDYLEDLRWKSEAAEEGTDDGSSSNGTKEPIVLPVQYEGMTIVSDGKKGYMYSDAEGNDIPCRYISHTDENGDLVIDCWFDSRHDTYKPF